MRHSRRGFLKQVSAAAAVGLLLPGSRLWALAPGELLPEPEEAMLRELALKAIDAARAAGATFADVRVAVASRLSVSSGFDSDGVRKPTMGPPWLDSSAGYGVRAIVDGAWGFAGGYELTAEAVTAVAREAVAVARGNRPRRPRTLELVPTPRVDGGRWETPIERDPFSVSIGEQGDLQLAALAEAGKVTGLHGAGCIFDWARHHRVFASTEGSLIVQRLDQAMPSASAGADLARQVNVVVETVRRGGYGYEAVPPSLAADLRKAAEQAVAEAGIPIVSKSVDVGRYDIVFSHQGVARLLAATIGEAVNLERALGYRANEDGTSFAAPPPEVLGRYQVGSKLLTVRADRTRPHAFATVGWDDEGVKPEDYTCVRDGIIVDYHTSRETAPRLADWYRRRGEPVRSHGCTRGAGQVLPVVQLPNLTMEPGRDQTTVEDLIADTKRGLFVDWGYGASDQQLLNGQYRGASPREIRNGKLGAHLDDMAFQFVTPQLWTNLDAVGGPGSAGPTYVNPDAGGSRDALQLAACSVWAVPARFRQVNVLNVGRTA